MDSISILKNAVNSEAPHKVMLQELGLVDARIPSRPILELNIQKFGDYLHKCMGGNINSIIKRNTPKGNDDQMVVKHQIGVRQKIGDDKFKHNANYASKINTYSVLNKEHPPLVCRKEKREILVDFNTAKEEITAEYDAINETCRSFINDNINIAEILEIGSKRPNDGNYSYSSIGHINVRERIIDKKDVVVNITDTNALFGNNKINRYAYRPYNYGNGLHNGQIAISVSFKEECPKTNNYDITEYVTNELFSIEYIGHSHNNDDVPYDTKIHPRLFNHKFDGIDVLGLIDSVVSGIDKLSGSLDIKLEALKDKYSGEFYLSEMCDEGSAI